MFPVNRKLVTNRVPYKGFFGKFDPLMETFLEYETMYRETPPGDVFWKVWRKSIQGKWQKWCVVHVTKNNASATHFFVLSPKPVARFRWKRARQSFQASTSPAKFHPNPSKFPRFISENDIPDRYNNRRSGRISDRLSSYSDMMMILKVTGRLPSRSYPELSEKDMAACRAALYAFGTEQRKLGR